MLDDHRREYARSVEVPLSRGYATCRQDAIMTLRIWSLSGRFLTDFPFPLDTQTASLIVSLPVSLPGLHKICCFAGG
ncbi:MAG: hypothetical protein MUO26_05765 [Methanotrichaceae archaeon]|nr:hypothetical protein [Methanotrichaceae archaeon]